MAIFSRTSARTIRSNAREPCMKMWVFQTKGAESPPELCHKHCHGIVITMLSLPPILVIFLVSFFFFLGFGPPGWHGIFHNERREATENVLGARPGAFRPGGPKSEKSWEEPSMDQYQCRGKLLKNFEDHWSIRISPGKGMDQ